MICLGGRGVLGTTWSLPGGSPDLIFGVHSVVGTFSLAIMLVVWLWGALWHWSPPLIWFLVNTAWVCAILAVLVALLPPPRW